MKSHAFTTRELFYRVGDIFIETMLLFAALLIIVSLMLNTNNINNVNGTNKYKTELHKTSKENIEFFTQVDNNIESPVKKLEEQRTSRIAKVKY